MSDNIPTALTIAGSDSGGGAGLQADLKTFSAFGVYGMSVVTSVTAQNTMSVIGIHDLPAEFIELQIDAVMKDIGAGVVKIGMLSNPESVRSVSNKMREYGVKKLVVDPVMRAKGGEVLLQNAAERVLIEELLPLTYILTPNVPEAEILSGMKISSIDDMKEAAAIIQSLGPDIVITKGGHLESENEALDLLYDGSEFHEYKADRVDTKNTHGTGCTYSAAIAACLVKGLSPIEAVSEAKSYVTGGIRNSFNLGKGHGPLNHHWKYG